MEHVCAFCCKQGQVTVLAEDWAEYQNSVLAPGRPLACKDHYKEQQEFLAEQAGTKTFSNVQDAD